MTQAAHKRQAPWAIDGILYETRMGDPVAGVPVHQVVRVEGIFSDTIQEWVVDEFPSAHQAELRAVLRMAIGSWSPAQLAALWPMRAGDRYTLPPWAKDAMTHEPVGGLRVRVTAAPFVLQPERSDFPGVFLNAERIPGDRDSVTTFKVGP